MLIQAGTGQTIVDVPECFGKDAKIKGVVLIGDVGGIEKMHGIHKNSGNLGCGPAGKPEDYAGHNPIGKWGFSLTEDYEYGPDKNHQNAGARHGGPPE